MSKYSRTLTGVTRRGKFVSLGSSREKLSHENVDRIFSGITQAAPGSYLKFGYSLVRIEDFAAFLID